mmetsp:Transcript_9126/g.26302  ORF Transcript_9126/g.26302 Transcript_9126/m.26302 type:complete len:256 (+) Transcript_9126:55-822(+)
MSNPHHCKRQMRVCTLMSVVLAITLSRCQTAYSTNFRGSFEFPPLGTVFSADEAPFATLLIRGTTSEQLKGMGREYYVLVHLSANSSNAFKQEFQMDLSNAVIEFVSDGHSELRIETAFGLLKDDHYSLQAHLHRVQNLSEAIEPHSTVIAFTHFSVATPDLEPLSLEEARTPSSFATPWPAECTPSQEGVQVFVDFPPHGHAFDRSADVRLDWRVENVPMLPDHGGLDGYHVEVWLNGHYAQARDKVSLSVLSL